MGDLDIQNPLDLALNAVETKIVQLYDERRQLATKLALIDDQISRLQPISDAIVGYDNNSNRKNLSGTASSSTDDLQHSRSRGLITRDNTEPFVHRDLKYDVYADVKLPEQKDRIRGTSTIRRIVNVLFVEGALSTDELVEVFQQVPQWQAEVAEWKSVRSTLIASLNRADKTYGWIRRSSEKNNPTWRITESLEDELEKAKEFLSPSN